MVGEIIEPPGLRWTGASFERAPVPTPPLPPETCGHVEDGRRPCESPRGEHGPCPAHWRRLPLDERARLLANHAPTDLPEPAAMCLVPACSIPDTAADNVPVGDEFVCRGHWQRVPTDLRHEVTVGAPGAETRALAAIAASEERFAGRYPPRPVS